MGFGTLPKDLGSQKGSQKDLGSQIDRQREPESRKNQSSAVSHLFDEIANRTSQAAGRASTFMVAFGVVIVWAVTGPLFGYSDTWQLVIKPARRSSPS